jgi:hypothetical protein
MVDEFALRFVNQGFTTLPVQRLVIENPLDLAGDRSLHGVA